MVRVLAFVPLLLSFPSSFPHTSRTPVSVCVSVCVGLVSRMNMKKTCLLTSLPKLDKDSHFEFLTYARSYSYSTHFCILKAKAATKSAIRVREPMRRMCVTFCVTCTFVRERTSQNMSVLDAQVAVYEYRYTPLLYAKVEMLKC